MTQPPIPLQPGDCLLYAGRGFFSWAIRIKTWSDVSHVSGYIGDGRAAASRDGLGVNDYALRLDGLHAVLRLTCEFDPDEAARFLNETRGQKYDWWGLLRFFTWGKQSTDKQFCSEFLTRWYRAGGAFPFAEHYDADLVSPGMFLSAPCFRIVWHVKGTSTETSVMASAPAKMAQMMKPTSNPKE